MQELNKDWTPKKDWKITVDLFKVVKATKKIFSYLKNKLDKTNNKDR